MPQPPMKLKDRLKEMLIEESVTGYRHDYKDEHGTNPPHKAVSTFRKRLEKDPNLDRQVSDILREAIGNDDQGTLYTVIGSTLLLGVAASLLAAIGWEAARPWMPSVALLLTGMGLSLVFHRHAIPFVREHPLVSAILGVLFAACALLMKAVFGPVLITTTPQIQLH